MKHFDKIALVALLASALSGCANAQNSDVPLAQTAPPDAATPDAPSFEEGTLASQATKTTTPASVRRNLPRGAKSVFSLRAKLGDKNLLLHAWNSAKGDGHIDILAPSTTKSKSRPTYTRLNRVTLRSIEPTNYSIRLAPLKAGKPGWVMAVNWSEPQVAMAFSTVPMTVFIAPTSDSGKVLEQDTETESSTGGNVFYDLRVDKNGDAFLMLVSEFFDAGSKSLQPYKWNGSKFVEEGKSASRPLE